MRNVLRRPVRRRKKKKVTRGKPPLILTASEKFAAGSEVEAWRRRLDVVETLVNQFMQQQKPLMEELYSARQGALSVMKDLNMLKAAVLGHNVGWE